MDKHDEDLKLLSVQSVKVLLCAVIDTRWSRRQSCTTAAQSGILTSRVNSGIVRWHHHSICRFALSAIQPPALQHTWTWCILDDAIPHWKISFDCEFIHTGCKIIELVKSFKIFQSIFCAQTDCIQLIPNWKSRRMFVFPDWSDHDSEVTPEAQCWEIPPPAAVDEMDIDQSGIRLKSNDVLIQKGVPQPAHIWRWGRTSPAPPTTPITQPNPSNFFLCPS